MRIRRSNLGIIGSMFSISILIAICSILTFMFEYSFQTIFGKDLPWFLDLLGGLILNGVIFIVWFICFICNYSGVPSPWW